MVTRVTVVVIVVRAGPVKRREGAKSQVAFVTVAEPAKVNLLSSSSSSSSSAGVGWARQRVYRSLSSQRGR
jgi:hypothetical protein